VFGSEGSEVCAPNELMRTEFAPEGSGCGRSCGNHLVIVRDLAGARTRFALRMRFARLLVRRCSAFPDRFTSPSISCGVSRHC